MAVSFGNPSGRVHSAQTINVTALSASTTYIAQLTHGSGHTQNIEFTTDGTGAATLTFVPQGGGKHSVTVYPKTPTAAATGSNNFQGV